MGGQPERRWAVSAAKVGLVWAAICALPTPTPASADPPSARVGAGQSTPDDDRTFRPTVIVRKGTGQGSGTVIASVPGTTLVLTAAHVALADPAGELRVELHRYNLGVERDLPRAGWPLSLPAELVAADVAADVAVVRVNGRAELPFVARLSPPGAEPGPGAVVTSVGIDGGEHLNSWHTRVRENVWFVVDPPKPRPADRQRDAPSPKALAVDGNNGSASGQFRGRILPRPRPDEVGGPERPFLLTEKSPEQGRSGGGLYTKNAVLVGVCVGRIEAGWGKGGGVFASGESVQKILREHDLDDLIARSEAAHPRVSATSKVARPAPPAARELVKPRPRDDN